VNPTPYLADVLIRVHEHPNSRVDELLPHNWTGPTGAISRLRQLNNSTPVAGRLLPKRGPHLNSVDHLWRAVKKDICGNHQDENLGSTSRAHTNLKKTVLHHGFLQVGADATFLRTYFVG
jgi:hypothetical protein